jgi:hypothetical protein
MSSESAVSQTSQLASSSGAGITKRHHYARARVVAARDNPARLPAAAMGLGPHRALRQCDLQNGS